MKPGIDVALAETPLAADANCGNFPSFNETVDRTEIDLEVLEDFFGCEKRIVHHEFSILPCAFSPYAA